MNGGETRNGNRGRRDFIIAILWSGVERGGQTIFLLISTIVIARLCGPREFGVASLALSIIFILETAGDRLFRDVIVQRDHLSEREIGAALTTNILLSAFAALLLLLLAPTLSNLFGIPVLARYIMAGSLCILFTGSGGVPAALLHRNMHFAKLARRTLIGSLVGAIIGLMMVLSGLRGYSLVGQYVAQSLASLVAVLSSLERLPRPNTHLRSALPLIAYSIPVTISEFIWNASFRIFTAIVGYLTGPVNVGYLELSMRFVQPVRNLWQATVGPVALSYLVARRQPLDKFRQAYRRITAINTAASLPVFGGIIVIAGDLSKVALGDPWHSTIAIIQLLALAAGLSISVQFASITLNAVGRPGWNIITASAGAIAAIAGLFVFNVTTALQASIVWLVRLPLAQPLGAFGVSRASGLRIVPDLVVPTLKPFLATLGMVAITMALNKTLLNTLEPATRLPLSIAIGALSYVALLRAIAPDLASDAKSMITDLRSGSGPRPREAC